VLHVRLKEIEFIIPVGVESDSGPDAGYSRPHDLYPIAGLTMPRICERNRGMVKPENERFWFNPRKIE
jgi:hypothetical protein